MNRGNYQVLERVLVGSHTMNFCETKNNRGVIFYGWSLLIILIAFLSVFITGYGVRADDDNIWLYYTGSQIGNSQKNDQLVSMIQKTMRANNETDIAIGRFENRKIYSENYIAVSLIYRTVSSLFPLLPGKLRQANYPHYLSLAMISGFTIAFIIALFITYVVVLCMRDKDIFLAFVLSGTFMAFMSVFFPPGSVDLMNPVETVFDFVLRPIQLLASSHSLVSPFGWMPKSHFIMLTFIVFALRLKGQYAIAYMVLGGLCFVHQSMAGLLFAGLLLTDCVLRPHVLFNIRTFAPLVVVFGVILLRERIWHLVGLSREVVIGTAITGVIVMRLLYLKSNSTLLIFGALANKLSGLREFFQKREGGLSDLYFLLMIWVLSFPIAYIINSNVSYEQSYHFWSIVHGRFLGMIIRPLAFLSLSLLLIRTLKRYLDVKVKRTTFLVLLSCTVMIFPITLKSIQGFNNPIGRLEAQLLSLEKELGVPIQRVSEKENLIYYAMAKTLDTGVDWLKPLLPLQIK